MNLRQYEDRDEIIGTRRFTSNAELFGRVKRTKQMLQMNERV